MVWTGAQESRKFVIFCVHTGLKAFACAAGSIFRFYRGRKSFAFPSEGLARNFVTVLTGGYLKQVKSYAGLRSSISWDNQQIVNLIKEKRWEEASRILQHYSLLGVMIAFIMRMSISSPIILPNQLEKPLDSPGIRATPVSGYLLGEML